MSGNWNCVNRQKVTEKKISIYMRKREQEFPIDRKFMILAHSFAFSLSST